MMGGGQEISLEEASVVNCHIAIGRRKPRNTQANLEVRDGGLLCLLRAETRRGGQKQAELKPEVDPQMSAGESSIRKDNSAMGE